MKARVINVILVEDGANRTYFTLEGVEIGSFVAGRKTEPAPVEPEGPKSAITRPPSPEEVRREQDIKNDEAAKVENRYPKMSHGKRKEED